MSKYICIRAGTFRADITAEGFVALGVTKIRKLTRIMRSEHFENRETVSVIRETFAESIDSAKARWGNASRTYQNEYCLPERGKTPKERAVIRTYNKKLLDDVRRAKSAYEKLIRKQEIFEKEII